MGGWRLRAELGLGEGLGEQADRASSRGGILGHVLSNPRLRAGAPQGTCKATEIS